MASADRVLLVLTPGILQPPSLELLLEVIRADKETGQDRIVAIYCTDAGWQFARSRRQPRLTCRTVSTTTRRSRTGARIRADRRATSSRQWRRFCGPSWSVVLVVLAEQRQWVQIQMQTERAPEAAPPIAARPARCCRAAAGGASGGGA